MRHKRSPIEAVCSRQDPGRANDGASANMVSLYLQADLPRPGSIFCHGATNDASAGRAGSWGTLSTFWVCRKKEFPFTHCLPTDTEVKQNPIASPLHVGALEDTLNFNDFSFVAGGSGANLLISIYKLHMVDLSLGFLANGLLIYMFL